MYHHYDWIIIMGYSRHELGKIIMLYSPKKICHITPLPLHNGHLSTTRQLYSVPKVAVVERFDCINKLRSALGTCKYIVC